MGSFYNDDPDTRNSALKSLIPQVISALTYVIGGDIRRGVTGGLNEAITTVKNEWLLFVDSDDLIIPEVFEVLRHYITKFERCRYISSGMIDIDDKNEVLRYRRHDLPSTHIYSCGMIAGHLKAIRRDLLNEKGLLCSSFNLSQDFEFALRVVKDEPIFSFLSTFTAIAGTQRRNRHHRPLVKKQLGGVPSASTPRTCFPLLADPAKLLVYPHLPVDRTKRIHAGASIVRTQGARPELLAETLASIEQQQLPTTPIVVVHGDDLVFQRLERFLYKT